MLKIAGAKVFRNGEFVEDDIFIEGDRIVATGDEVGEVIDAKGLLAIPGLVDVHSHGAVGHDFCDGTHESIDAITRYQPRRNRMVRHDHDIPRGKACGHYGMRRRAC